MSTTRVLEGRPVAEALLGEARAAIVRSGSRRPPSLVSVHRATTSPFAFYLKQQAKNASAAGISFREEPVEASSGARAVRERLGALDADPAVDAVLLEHPLPPELDFAGAVSALRVAKDVDGVSAESLGRLVQGVPVHAPAVALGGLALLRHYGYDLGGRRVAVVGRSPTVGLPLALLLVARHAGADATVTVAHSRTPDLRAALATADVILSCAGKPGLLTRSVVPEGATIVDIGLSSIPDPQRPGGQRPAGDADLDSLDGWAAAVTPTPGGTGPVTVAQLMRSTVRAWEPMPPVGVP